MYTDMAIIKKCGNNCDVVKQQNCYKGFNLQYK